MTSRAWILTAGLCVALSGCENAEAARRERNQKISQLEHQIRTRETSIEAQRTRARELRIELEAERQSRQAAAERFGPTDPRTAQRGRAVEVLEIRYRECVDRVRDERSAQARHTRRIARLRKQH